MCCIFTCCGWMIDLIQRLWTFTMACCISSAVCCALVTASMSGIALGYNYSLAEYIDLKETNVSVYLKRGVFDDEIADDMNWRRSGHMPVEGHLKDSNLMTGEQAGPEEMPLRSGRRMDDSVIVSDDKHKFEGSLMRLTAKPPDGRRMGVVQDPAPEPVTSDSQMVEIVSKYPMGSLEQMKAIHGLMNMRSGGQRNTILPPTLSAQGHEMDGRRVMPVNKQTNNMHPMDYGPVISDAYHKFNPARFAVPDESIREPANWLLPKNQVPDAMKRTMDLVDYDNVPSTRATRPQPFRFSTEIQRPTQTTSRRQPTHTAKPEDISGAKVTAIGDTPLERFRNKMMMERMDVPGLKKDHLKDLYKEQFDNKFKDQLKEKLLDQFKDQFKAPSMSKELLSEEDYEEEANKGLPIRKKRNKRNVMNGEINTLHATFGNTHMTLNELNESKITKSVLISKIISSTSNYTCSKQESSTDKLIKSSIQPQKIEQSFFKSISRFLSFL